MNDQFLSQLPESVAVSRESLDDVAYCRLQPGSAEDVLQVVRLANQTATRLAPWFHQTAVSPEIAYIDFASLNRVHAYRSEEFLITLETGTTIAQLEETLDAQDQRMALSYDKSRTLLQVLGDETPSLSGTRYGFLRQWVMGLEAVTGDGVKVHYGGEVVKNVTGYDLSKLFVGSQHNFGLITKVTLKLEPKPQASRAFLFHTENMDQAVQLVHQFHLSLNRPEVLSLFRIKKSFGWQILLILSGHKESVSSDFEKVKQFTSHLQSDTQELFLAPLAIEQWKRKLDWLHPEEKDALVIRVALPHKPLFDSLYHLGRFPQLKAADLLLPMRTNQLLLRSNVINLPETQDIMEIQEYVRSLQGFVQVLRFPPKKPDYAKLFNTQDHAVLNRWRAHLKEQYDPNGILAGNLLNQLKRPEEVLI